MDIINLSSPEQLLQDSIPLAPDIVRVRLPSGTFAAKIRDLDQASDAEIENLVTGVRFSRSLRHRNILPFIAAFMYQSSLWFISPYCDLRSASDLCKPFGLPELLICAMIRDTLRALDYLHNKGIIHRAICGSHILVKSDSRCFLTGLNYATSVVKNGLWRTSLHDFPSGAKKNLILLAPEILEQNLLGYNHKSDIYSLGVTCCELANGIVPYWNLEPAEMMLDKLTGNHAKPIDQSCAKYIEITPGIAPEDRERYEVYKNRRFSDSFHTFCITLCLNSDPHKRPTAQQLLSHRFLKQLKKASTSGIFTSLLHQKSQEMRSHAVKNKLNPKSGPDHQRHDVEWLF